MPKYAIQCRSSRSKASYTIGAFKDTDVAEKWWKKNSPKQSLTDGEIIVINPLTTEVGLLESFGEPYLLDG